MSICRVGLLALGVVSLLSAGLAEEDGLCTMQIVQHQIGRAVEVQELQDEEDDEGSTVPDAIGTGCKAALSIVSATKGASDNGLDVKGVQDALSGIATVAGIIPPPVGLIASSVLGLAGGILGLFGDDDKTKKPKPKAITNKAVIQAMQKGFKAVQKKLSKINLKMDSIKNELDELKQIAIVHDELNSPVLDEIREATAELQSLFEGSLTVAPVVDTNRYFHQLKLYVDKFDAERFGRGAVSPENVQRAIHTLSGPTPVEMCRAGDFYKRILAARFELFQMVNTNNYASADNDIMDPAERREEKARLALQSLQELHSDLKKFKQLTDDAGHEANLRWELGQGTDCSTPRVGPGAMLVYGYGSSSPMCFRQPKLGYFLMAPCSGWENQYFGETIFIDPWTGYVTNNPGNTFDFPALCLKIAPKYIPWNPYHSLSEAEWKKKQTLFLETVSMSVEWADCTTGFFPKLRATGPSTPGTYGTTSFQLKADGWNICAYVFHGKHGGHVLKTQECPSPGSFGVWTMTNQWQKWNPDKNED